MLFKTLTNTVKLPTKHGPGWNLYAPRDIVMFSGEVVVVNLELKINIPEGWIGFLVGRIGPLTRGVDPLEFLEPDPTGVTAVRVIGPYLSGEKEVAILIKNLNGSITTIPEGKPICHLVIVKCLIPA